MCFFSFENATFSGESEELEDADYYETTIKPELETTPLESLEITPLETTPTSIFDEFFSSQNTNKPIEFTTVLTTEAALPIEAATGRIIRINKKKIFSTFK